MTERVQSYRPGDPIPANHRFDDLRLTLVRSRGQGGLRLALAGHGRFDERVVGEQGIMVERTVEFAAEFVLRPGEDGRWFIVEVRSQEER